MRYYSSPDGGFHWRGQEGPVPPDWTLISKPAYEAALARIEARLLRLQEQTRATEGRST